MPIEIGIWRLSKKVKRVDFKTIDSENRLEELIATDISVIDSNLLLIGRQVPTLQGKFIDLLAIDGQGKLSVIELKKNRTPRDVVAQVLDYGSWVRTLEDDAIAEIFEKFITKHYPERNGVSLDETFCEYFNVKTVPDEFNETHKLIIVAGELDESTERIINYLGDEHGVAINAVFFRFFQDGDHEFLCRAWLTDPGEIDKKVEAKREKLPWNGEFYASFGANEHRDWAEAVKYGFISAGGGAWYTGTLKMLEPGARVWVNIPGVGYVGVGTVIDKTVPITEFLVKDGNGKMVPITSLSLESAKHKYKSGAPEAVEHFVRMEWIKTVPESQAVREKGLFGNTNSVAKPRANKWVHTIDRLKQRFEIAS